MVDPVAPDDIATRRDPVADPDVVPRAWRTATWTAPSGGPSSGCSATTSTGDARARRPGLAGDERAGLPATTFAWAGGLERGAAHYYAVRGATFLLEYDNAQDGANHIHTVWRDLRSDWGTDLLAAHYAGRL